MLNRFVMACVCLLALAGCGKKDSPPPSQSTTQPAEVAAVEKVKPAPGAGNVQGRVLYNGAPVPNIEATLCETFSRFLGGCGGKTYSARTDNDGVYVIVDVEPKEYEGLMVRVFDTDSYVFATTGIGGLSAAKYNVVADKTLFVNTTHLFKGDLKTRHPSAGSTVNGQGLELTWEPYPDAAYYKFSLYPENQQVEPPYVNERVEAASFKVNKPLEKGTYRWKVEAFNSSDRKLSETSDDIKFTIG